VHTHLVRQLVLPLVLAAVLLLAPRATLPAHAPAVSEAVCFGYTIRLALRPTSVAAAQAPDGDPVRGTDWDAVITAPGAGPLPDRVSADVFSIRGQNGNRLDVWATDLERGEGWLRATGPLLLPPQPGGVQDGDRGRVFVSIGTPRGSVAVPGLQFRVERAPDGLHVADVQAFDPRAFPATRCA
jgi:hypothetical protein